MELLKPQKSKAITEFGDFQTPGALALRATRLLPALGVRVQSIIEPTCGRGSFLNAAVACFPEADAVIGVDINLNHLKGAETSPTLSNPRVELFEGDFFKVNWGSIVTKERGPWLIIGNPPWVTSSGLGAIESSNLPEKSNFHGRAGMDAITGKSNFDISEWMLMRYLDWLEGSDGTIAVLCKTSVARKILLYVWKMKVAPIQTARIYKIDALSNFGAAVDACFFVLEIMPKGRASSCDIFDSLDAPLPSRTIGFLDGHIISNVADFKRHRELLGPEDKYVWRSGVKHDCSKVMELAATSNGHRNGLEELVDIEDDFLFPLLKSSDIANGRSHRRASLLVTQRLVGEDTLGIRTKAPKTWLYLNRHAGLLNKRGSVIYKDKPAFSVFGVGPYTFAPWKVAISGFYKSLKFLCVGPVDGKPVVFDDTIYFLPCWSEEEARFIEQLLLSDPAQAFFQSMIHWDEKRPVTVEILKRLSIRKLAAMLGKEQDYLRFTGYENLPLFAS
jgi:methylase of polypeptide subunit release factors